MTRLHDLYEQQGQSPWIDNLNRPSLRDGGLKRLVDDGIRGMTSNPTIFQKAMTGSTAYDEQFAELLESGTVEDAYWAMVFDDISEALRLMRPVHDSSGGTDGFVSLELAPALANDTAKSAEMARAFHERFAAPNLMIKIPGTAAGVPAVREMVSEGRRINITLIFGLDRYADVIEAYLSGLEAFASTRDADLSEVDSVASFFLSRVDTEVDRRLESIGTSEALALRGKAAVAQGKLAYRLFKDRFSGKRWEALAARGAKVQRPLWASTSTKNPDYPDLLYVDTLIGPDTVNTLPDPTVAAFLDHGTVARTVDVGVDEAERTLSQLADVGIDMDDVTRVLEDEGVAAFVKSFDEMLQALQDKANALTS